MAVLAWVEVQNPELRKQLGAANAESATTARTDEQIDIEAWRRTKTDECQSWLDKCTGWGHYLLDARIGMKVQTGIDTLTWYKREKAQTSG